MELCETGRNRIHVNARVTNTAPPAVASRARLSGNSALCTMQPHSSTNGEPDGRDHERCEPGETEGECRVRQHRCCRRHRTVDELDSHSEFVIRGRQLP